MRHATGSGPAGRRPGRTGRTGWTLGRIPGRPARLGAALVLAAAGCAAAGCGGGPDSAEAASGVVRSSWGDPPNPLEPADTNEVEGGKVLGMIFRGLKRYDPVTGRAENAVAQRITTRDQRTYAITLKDGWTFSNGEKVTARSFVDAWNYGALLSNAQKDAYFFQYVQGYDRVHPARGRPTARTMSGLRVRSARTFTVRLTQKFSTWPDTLGYPAYAPLPRAFFRHHARWLARPIGDGPYVVDSYVRGAVMRLRRRPDYPGPDRAHNQGVDLRVYTDSNTAYTDLLAGNLDVVDDIPAFQLQHVRADLHGRYLTQPAGILQTLAFPMYDPDWNGRRAGSARRAVLLRRGLSMAIDRKQITQRILGGTRTPATDWTSPVLGRKGGYQPGLCGDACQYHPARARRLIRAAGGLPGGRITLAYNADTGSHKEWIDAVCDSIDRVLGRDRACTGAPVGTFADYRNRLAARRMTGPFRAGWQMDYPLIQDFLQPLYYTGSASNDGRFSSRAFDRLVDRANAAPDRATTVADYRSAERILADQMPAIPLWYQNGSAGYSGRVHDVTLDQFSTPVYDRIRVG